MKKYRQIELYGVGLAACAVATTLSVVLDCGTAQRAAIAAPLFAFGLVLILYAATRALRFQGKLRRFVRHLLAGNYEVGVHVSRTHDEIHALEKDLEKLGEHLRTYDQLRAARVRSTQLLLDLVMEHVCQPLLLLEVKKGILECNPSLQTLLNAGQRKFNLSAVTKIAANASFISLLEKTVATEKAPQKGQVNLQLPGAASAHLLDLLFCPVKNSQGDVEQVLIIQKTA